MFLSWTVSAAADLLSCLPAFQTELADGQWVAIVIFAPHPLAWLECVRHLGLPQNAVGFELTSQDSIQEPRWPWGCVWGGRGFRYRQRTWGRKRLPHQEGITSPAPPPQPLAAATKSLQSCPTLRPHGLQPTRLLRPWDSPGKNTGVGCHFLLQPLASTPNFSTQGYQQPGENSHSRSLIKMCAPFPKPTSTFISVKPVRSRR